MSDEGVISKTTYTFTVLHPTDQPPSNIFDALDESDTGHSVAAVVEQSTSVIPNSAVPDELKALGNDGGFFDLELGLEDD